MKTQNRIFASLDQNPRRAAQPERGKGAKGEREEGEVSGGEEEEAAEETKGGPVRLRGIFMQCFDDRGWKTRAKAPIRLWVDYRLFFILSYIFFLSLSFLPLPPLHSPPSFSSSPLFFII